MTNLQRNIIWTALFAISMGFFEAALVVYIREIYYPEGFAFPLKMMDKDLALTEIIREIMSMLMIVSVAFLAAKKATLKFAYFIFIFAIWDIFYYIFLKLTLGWPASFLTWDILYLLPTFWTGPVITPLIVSLTMMLFALAIFYAYSKHQVVKMDKAVWILMLIGAFTIFTAFIYDYSAYILDHFTIAEIIKDFRSDELRKIVFAYIPREFNWWLFIAGEIFLLLSVHLFTRHNKLT
jgi:hypothetical protein